MPSFHCVKVVQYGNQYKIITYKTQSTGGCGMPRDKPVEIDLETGEVISCKLDSSEDSTVRALANLSRARSRVKELTLCNPWTYFVTLTLDPAKFPQRGDLGLFKKRLGEFFQNYKKRHPTNSPKYLLIPEQHKDGAWHMHGFINGLDVESLLKNEHGYLDFPEYRRRFGYISLDPVRDIDRAASYITKYITKSFTPPAPSGGAEQGNRIEDMQAREAEYSRSECSAESGGLRRGEHLFLASKGLQGCTVLGVGCVEGEFSDFCDWENDYVGLRWTRDEDFVARVLDECDNRTARTLGVSPLSLHF